MQEIIDVVKEIQKLKVRLNELKPAYREFLVDQSIDLDTRWLTWLMTPNELKGGYGWISSGRLKAFSVIGVKDPTEYGGMFYWDRHQTKDYADYLDCSLEIISDSEEGEYGVESPWNEKDDSIEEWLERNHTVKEFVRQFKEEVLASGLIGFKYDW